MMNHGGCVVLGMWHVCCGKRNACGDLQKDLKKRKNFKNPGVDGRIILKFTGMDGNAWTGLILFWIGTKSGIF